MAWTTSFLAKTVHGNQRCVQMRLTPDAATQTVETGLSYIDMVLDTRASAVTGFIYANSNASGVASNGVLGCSGFTSGDVIYVTVYGR